MPKTDHLSRDEDAWDDHSNQAIKGVRRAARAESARRRSARLRAEAEAIRQAASPADATAACKTKSRVERNRIRHTPRRVLSVTGERRAEPDVRRFARTVIGLAMAEAEREAQCNQSSEAADGEA